MLPMLVALDTLLSTVTWRERFVARCFDKDDPHRTWVEQWSEDRLAGLRWQVISNFCTKASCSYLANVWGPVRVGSLCIWFLFFWHFQIQS